MTASSAVTEPGQYSIRFAQPTDAAALARLRYALRASMGRATEPETEFIERCSTWMHQHLQSEAWHCWVAESSGQLIGAVWLQVVEKIPNPRNEAEHHAYITNFYVQEKTRGSGIGSQLLRGALDWCQAQEVHAVILWPTERSRSLYERFGFAVRDDIMELIVKPVP
jgi:GNAT superfamily N-acetyltransferase